ncbi:MAG: MBL fold metallo-hydrolase [Desulfobacterales bacterium]|nr:MBL fold metallo-hydrolase [Desulfobacterales bacterium]
MRVAKPYDFGEIKGIKLGWSLFGPPLMTVYCYMIGDLMVDTGQAHMQPEALEIAGDHKIKRVFLTHHHEDHSGNAAALKQHCRAQVFGHPLTKTKMATTFRIQPYQRYVWGKSKPIEIETFPDCVETVLGQMVPVHTPGHSKDHTAFLLKDAGILFSGDLYLADTIKFFRSDEDVGTQIDSLRKILDLDFEILLCGHFPKLANGKKRIENKLAFLESLYGDIIRLWDTGLPERQIFKALSLKEDYFIKCFCFGNVSMLNGVKSVIRHYEDRKRAAN